MDKETLIEKALFIRGFEEKLLSLFSEGELHGTIHACIGQEWTGVAAAEAAVEGDTVFSNHRCHGHFLAWTGDAAGLLAEIMGKPTGVCGGLGGSQHLFAKGFYSNGIQGGMVPIAAGKALAGKMAQSDRVCLVFTGDGTLGQGILYETLNIVSLWDIPLLVVVENNGIAQSTPTAKNLAGTVEGRARAFAIEYRRSNTWAWTDLIGEFEKSIEYVREQTKPCVLEIDTCRLKPHSKGDDTRDADEVKKYEEIDPINTLRRENPSTLSHIEKENSTSIELALTQARETGRPAPAPSRPLPKSKIRWEQRVFDPERVVNSIHDALKRNFDKNPNLVMLGEDIEAPYGGAFKVTRDLSELFPGRVMNTPISEAAIVGLGTGLALGGYLPIVEIMFGDFLTLAFDQLVNHACKLQFMYNGRVKVPLVVRTPMGGRRGYGPTHSQSLEKHFLGIPDLDILALNARVPAEKIYDTLFETVESPTLVVENKVLYTRFLHAHPIAGYEIEYSDEIYPTVRLRPSDHRPEATVFCYGGMLEEAEKAILAAFDEFDCICEVICPSRLQPMDIRPLLDSVRTTGRLVTVEEGPGLAGLGSEVIARLLENGARLDLIRRVYCDSFVPCSPRLESETLPGAEHIVAALKEVTRVGA